MKNFNQLTRTSLKSIVWILAYSLMAACNPYATNDTNSSGLLESGFDLDDVEGLFKLKESGQLSNYIDGMMMNIQPIAETCTGTVPAGLTTRPERLGSGVNIPFKLSPECSYRLEVYFGKIDASGSSLSSTVASNPNDNTIQKSDLALAATNGSGSYQFSPTLDFVGNGSQFLEWGEVRNSQSNNGPLQWSLDMTTYKFETTSGAVSMSQIIGNKDYLITIFSSTNCPYCQTEYPKITQLDYLQQSKCAVVISGYGYKTAPEFKASAAKHGLNTSFPMAVGFEGEKILDIFFNFYKGTIDDVRFPLVGIVDRAGNPVKVFNFEGQAGDFAKGKDVIDANKQVIQSICQ